MRKRDGDRERGGANTETPVARDRKERDDKRRNFALVFSASTQFTEWEKGNKTVRSIVQTQTKANKINNCHRV